MRSDAPARISLLVPNLNFGGAEKAMVYLANEFVEHQLDVEIMAIDVSGPLSAELDRRVQLFQLRAGGVTSAFKTSKSNLDRGLELMAYLQEDSDKMAARDLHELTRCWENIQRMWIAESHIRTMLFREETRWPGYYFRSDTPKMDEENWLKFANCRWDPSNGEWEMMKKDVWNIPGV